MGEVINMNPQTEETKKLSYEELENIAMQLQSKCQSLYNELASISNAFKRLECLFKVLENHSLFTDDFINKCTAEVEDIMTIKTEETKDE